jgi:predicted nucleotidyltransferase
MTTPTHPIGHVSPTHDHVIREAVRLLVEHFDPVRIMLFGSTARGSARPDSDLDVLVVLSAVEDKREAAIAMRHRLAHLPLAIDVLVATPDELDQRGWIVGTVLHDALSE